MKPMAVWSFPSYSREAGKLSRKSQIVLLCEDKQQETFAYRFLLKMGWTRHQIRIRSAKPGEGSAEQYVRDRFPKELVQHRSTGVSRALMVMMDGDDRGISGRMAELDGACKKAKTSPRTPKEQVLVFIPTWCIETWLAYLDGKNVVEAKRDYPRLPRPRDCAPHVNTLVEMCQKNQLRQPAPASLAAACSEYRRWADSA